MAVLCTDAMLQSLSSFSGSYHLPTSFAVSLELTGEASLIEDRVAVTSPLIKHLF